MQRSWIADAALVLATITFAGYAVAFSYETGYLGYFEIPASLVTLDPPTILGAVLRVAPLLGYFTFLGLCGCIAILHLLKQPYATEVAAVILVLFPGLVFLRLQDYAMAIIHLAGALPLAGLTFLLPLWTQRGKRRYSEKLLAQQEFDSQHEITPKLIRAFPSATLIVVAAIVVVYPEIFTRRVVDR